MQSLADDLPHEIACLVPPEWRANEKNYWSVRDKLLDAYNGLWIAFVDGNIIASGTSAVDVLHDGAESGRHPFVVRVGAEFEPCLMRRLAFRYNNTYPGEPLPQIGIEFRTANGAPGIYVDQVIPDTGADATALPWSDCRKLGLDVTMGLPAQIGGVAGSTAPTLMFPIWVFLDGKQYRCRLQADFQGKERILGRDILNRIEVLFRGPSGEVIVNP